MFTDKLLVFSEIMVIRPCFIQELSSAGTAPAAAPDCGPACSARPSPHAQANWWPWDFTLLMFAVAHSSSLLNERPLTQAALSSFISGFVFSV